MQNREAALYVTESLMDVMNKVMTSVEHIDALKEGNKVSQAEAETYRLNMVGALDKMLQSVLNPVFAIHPDLNPNCRCCGVSEEKGALSE